MSIDARNHDDAETYDERDGSTGGGASEGGDDGPNSPISRWADDWLRHPEKAYAVMTVFLGGVLLTTSLFPLYWLFVVAMAPPGQTNIPLIPTTIDLSAFVVIFQKVPFARFMFNSLFYATTVTIVVLLIGSLAGYAFGRLEFRGKTPLLFSLLVLSFFPRRRCSSRSSGRSTSRSRCSGCSCSRWRSTGRRAQSSRRSVRSRCPWRSSS
ncbi:hypothetical protein ACFQLZ_12095 [Halospeciosus flavus]